MVEAAGRQTTAKVLTTPSAPEQAVMEGIDRVLRSAGLAPDQIALVIHGTTLATNAVIERTGALTALITTEGFRDVLAIADESRFDQYDINLVKTEPLVPRHRRLTVTERIGADGRVLVPLDEAAVAALVPALEALAVESVAIGFLHSYANPAHEQRCAALLRAALPDLWLTLSSEVCPEIREYERFTTASANAYVQPRIAGYLQQLERGLAAAGLACPLFLMTSGGGLMTVAHAIREPIRLIESGPAGGAILAARIAEECGLERVLSFDMGGTTAKICLIDDFRPDTSRNFEVDRQARFVKGSGLPLRIPVIEMVEIGAGGGSIARLDPTRQIRVGPASAGSEPGPACYGRGGTAPTVTDADVALGRIDPAGFAGGRLPLDAGAARAALLEAIGAPLGLDAEPRRDRRRRDGRRDHGQCRPGARGRARRGRRAADPDRVRRRRADPRRAARREARHPGDRGADRRRGGLGGGLPAGACRLPGGALAPSAPVGVRPRAGQRGCSSSSCARRARWSRRPRPTPRSSRAGAPTCAMSARATRSSRACRCGRSRPRTGRRCAPPSMTTYRALYGRLIPDLDIEVLSWGLSLSSRAEPIAPAGPPPAAYRAGAGRAAAAARPRRRARRSRSRSTSGRRWRPAPRSTARR